MKLFLLSAAATIPLILVDPAFAAQVRAVDPARPATQAATPDGDPIITDSQFEEALPPIDAELAQPLAPIEDIDAMPAETPDAAAPSAQPAPPPAVATSAPDPALAQPLPSLATFDVEPPQAVAEDDAKPAPAVRYTVVVEGLDKVGLEDEFRGLSALEEGDGKGANGAVIAARAREDEALALRILKSEGYYDAVVTSVVEPVQGQPGRATATISATAGTRYALGAITIEGPDTTPPGMPREILALKTGDPIVAATVEAAEAGISLQLPQRGYPFVAVGARDIELDDADHTGDYTLPVDPGPRSSFGGYRTTGKQAFDAKHVGVLARFKRGELYDNRKVDDLREAMVATGLFDSVAVEPQRTGETAPDGTEYVDLLVTQNAGPARRLAATAGYSTGQGLRVDGSWTHKNLFRPEGALIVAAVAGTQEQGLSGTFRRSNAGKRDRTVLLSLSANRQDYDAYEALTLGINGRISRDSTPIWQKKWTWAYGFEALATRETRFDDLLSARTRQNYFIGGINGQLGYDTSDSLLDPKKGMRAMVRLSPEISQSEGKNFQYARALVEGSAYYPVSDSLVIAGRVRFGTIMGAPRDEIAPSRRLYAGGGGSVRGFGYQQLGPRDLQNNPIGGRSLVEGAIEARYRFGDFGIVPFLDIGQVYESSTPGFSDLRMGAGIGGRFYTNFGPLRLDVATPLGRRKGEAAVAVYISIGQAF
ncbi:autotransporter assembly complex protein TamA [Sphingomonas colocasiae]|uniref:BamA/TamA family outer membrane protein n=1 Tax=Sphingomonas colocasiae TaxID=1848973 RepID=A0ABS7PWS3_9SPHN|nr:BamA/TamA family outer membrane protein [Sphingomonas colocasiae]MBY8825733.1 BamA/TamA family outer membrane protein [Sphingomonas colocasiae]